jgi:chemotaxis protein MotB
LSEPSDDEEEAPDESWMATFADTITLLMAFFVMLLTFAEFDIPAYEELSSALANTVGGREAQTTTQSLKIDVQDIVYGMQADQAVQVTSDEKGVVIDLDANAFFQPASAELVPAAIPVLTKLSETLASPNYELYNIAVEGHTDDGQISTDKFPSNWELSSQRASSVVRLFESNAVERSRLQARGYADTRPKVPNRDLQGAPIPENRATNRRVVLRLHPMSIDERDAYLRAQEFKLQQEEAAQRALAAKGPSIAERLAIQPTPDQLTDGQRQIKLALDNVIRDAIVRAKGGRNLTNEDIAELQTEVDQLSVAREPALESYFSTLEGFLNEERNRLSYVPVSN